MFPIFDDPKKFKERARRRIKRLPPDAQALIEKLQPYNTPKPMRSALWTIETLDASDKHQLLTITVPVAESTEIRGGRSPVGTILSWTFMSPILTLKHDAVVAVVTATPPAPDMQVDAEITPEIAFSDTDHLGRPRFVVKNLKILLAQIDQTISDFKAFF